MGFFDSFSKAFNDRDVIDMYNEDDEENGNYYRQRCFENTPSNHGWYKCIKCGKSFRKGDMDIDHIIPKSKGGTNRRENLQCICKHCNRSKQDDTSETNQDLKRRKKELKAQDKEDLKFLREARKIQNKEKRKK